MIPKELNQISEVDLQLLIDSAISEGKTIEYKQSLPGNSDSEKKEFLADVSSFANTVGGDLVYGISEDIDTRTPVQLTGLNITNIDQEIGRLDNIIRDGIEPRMPGVTVYPVNLANFNIVLVIRISKSWISPHRVTFKGHDKFYARSSNGKYPLDVSELRIAFNLSETLAERIRKFREERISKIYANDMPVPFIGGAKVALHLIPLNAFNPTQRYDINSVPINTINLPPIYCGGWDGRYNFDGYLTYSGIKEGGKYSSYAQLFSNGIIEAVGGSLFSFNRGKLLIHGFEFEEKIIQAVKSYFTILNSLQVELPIFLFMTLIGIKGYGMYINEMANFVGNLYPIERDILLIPEVKIETFTFNASKLLKSCFDTIWNACGFPRSLSYNNTGEWMPKR